MIDTPTEPPPVTQGINPSNGSLVALIPKRGTQSQERNLLRQKLLHAKHDYIVGDETLPELAERYKVPHKSIVMKSNKEGWRDQRRLWRDREEARFLQKTKEGLADKQLGFLANAEDMLSKVSNALHMHLDKINGDQVDSMGLKPTIGDVVRAVKALETYVNIGRKQLMMDAPVSKRDPVQEAIDVTPIEG